VLHGKKVLLLGGWPAQLLLLLLLLLLLRLHGAMVHHTILRLA
jgi:hypothetical protein